MGLRGGEEAAIRTLAVPEKFTPGTSQIQVSQIMSYGNLVLKYILNKV